MYCAISSSGCQELGKGALKVVLNERGDTFFLAMGDNEEVLSAGLRPVVDPARSWKYVQLQT